MAFMSQGQKLNVTNYDEIYAFILKMAITMIAK